MKLKMRTTSILLILLALAMIAPMTVMAPPTQETVDVWWLEDAQRDNGDGTFHSSWSNDRIPRTGEIEFRVIGKTYHTDMELFYNVPPLNLRSSPFVIANGKFAVWARYTSGSGLPILDKLRGELTIDEDEGTAYGSYVQYSYAFGTAEVVLDKYPYAKESPRAQGMWLIGITYYTVHGKT